MVNARYPAILAVFIILIAMTAAGCTSPGSSTTPTPTTPEVATPVPIVTSAWSTLGSMIDLTDVHSFEYQMTSSREGSLYTSMLRWDYNISYQGQPVNKITVTSGDNATNQVLTYYMNVSSGAILGGHIKAMSGGQVVKDEDVGPGAVVSTTSGMGLGTENPLLSYRGKSKTDAGTESVIVPAGTYITTKYTWLNGDTTGAAWMAPDVPIPVKISASSSVHTAVMELAGWS